MGKELRKGDWLVLGMVGMLLVGWLRAKDENVGDIGTLVIIDSVVESDTKWSLRNGDW